MFIDVTRYGGLRLLRLAVPAIAYLDAVEGGSAIHLMGGETLRVNEDPAQIEARVDATLALSTLAAGWAGAAEEHLDNDGLLEAPTVRKHRRKRA